MFKPFMKKIYMYILQKHFFLKKTIKRKNFLFHGTKIIGYKASKRLYTQTN